MCSNAHVSSIPSITWNLRTTDTGGGDSNLILGATSACPFMEVRTLGLVPQARLSRLARQTGEVPLSRVSCCFYLGRRHVLNLCYNRLRADSLSVVQRLSASRSNRYRSTVAIATQYFTIQSLLKLLTLFTDALLNTSLYCLICIQGGILFTSEFCPPQMLRGGHY